MRLAQPGRCDFVLFATAVQPPGVGTIATEVAAAQSSKDLICSRNTQAKSVLEILFLAIPPAPAFQGYYSTKRALALLIRVHPLIRRDPLRRGQLDHVHRAPRRRSERRRPALNLPLLRNSGSLRSLTLGRVR
jgi:hypothetical protein